MSRRAFLEDQIAQLLSLLLLIYHVTTIAVDASSTPKHLVNLYTHSPNDNVNITNSKQFQNEYQYRQVSSKPIPPDRYKSSTPSTSEGSVFDHTSSELSNAGTLDYSYQDNRGTANVPDCKGRLKLNDTRGYITDGPGFYQTNLQCIWLIDSGRNNATIRIQFHQFNTECNYDYLYIFDGDSIYSPLVAALSGDMKDFNMAFAESRLEKMISSHNNQTNYNKSLSTNSQLPGNYFTSSAIIPTGESRFFELKTNSGKAFVYFHSDTAQKMPGFYLTYSVDSCPMDCSNKGECDHTNLTCKCNSGYFGEGCQYILCPANCTSPQHGYCDKERSCVCNDGFHGPDCSMKTSSQTWVSLANSELDVPPIAFHQSIVVNSTMWIIGGKVQAFSNTNMGIFKKKKTTTVISYEIEARKWSDVRLEGTTGVDHLAELSGHSVAAKGNKVFIYGGMALNNTILDCLTVLDTKVNSLTNLPNGKKSKSSDEEFIAPIAVVGHTANIIDSHMYIFLGYNPLYGYLNLVQKFNLADNSWSFAGKSGSSVTGCIGHTSVFDPTNKLVYIYGGHHAHRSNNLYSFDPHTERWTFLQAGPSPRYYHSSIIIDKQLIVFGGNSYNTSNQSDQCFQQTYLTYDLSCSKVTMESMDDGNSSSIRSSTCGRKCWQSIDDPEPGILKRHGQSVVRYNRVLILFGGFNGMLMNDLRFMNISQCELLHQESECLMPKLALHCIWNTSEEKCEDQLARDSDIPLTMTPDYNCTKSELRTLQHVCESRETCTDCLNTNAGCVWCGFLSQCQYSKCKSSNGKVIFDANSCYKDEFVRGSLSGMNFGSHSIKDLPIGQDIDVEMECKRNDNCYLCHTKPQCSWQNDGCIFNSPVVQSPTSGLSPLPQNEFNEMYSSTSEFNLKSMHSNGTRLMQIVHPFNSIATFTTSSPNPSSYQSCELPCYLRRSCNECTTTKCIWCSTSEQCVDSSAYFAYHAMGQCMHYVAHSIKCPVASCSDIETCDKCLTNPKCGWFNDVSNTGKGRCIEGNSSGPSFDNKPLIEMSNSSNTLAPSIPNWFYTSCPSCQCNGHSYCKPNSNVCLQPCQDNTEGLHCERCLQGFYGDPINGGSCRPCRCNGHAQSCHRETGKCYCSTKGIIGHNCNKCDDQNHYIGDPTSPANGTCYYNLTTDYQYTFNMSKSEDHFYSDINFINVPLRRDSDVDFTIACSRLALVNITSGTSYKHRKPIHTSLECGSFRLRFPHDRHFLNDANYSFFVHVYKFQTPFILQIAFSQHRTLHLPQFFFTFSSCFLFFFALSGVVWKLKHEYDLYIRRQRQFIEMEQMASRPFSTILLELFKSSPEKRSDLPSRPLAEPTPISFEPCFGSNVGVLSLFVQLPGRPNLAIGSALVSLNDDTSNLCDDNNSGKRLEKERSPTQNA